jgi:hypothetical protein
MKSLDVNVRGIKLVFFVLSVLLVVVCVSTGWSSVTTNWAIQSVDEYGDGDHPDILTNDKVTVEGILLNRPDYMLDSTARYDAGWIGGMWQIFIQGELPGDHAGTAIWMGQNYVYAYGTGMYTDLEWRGELHRMSNDPNTAYTIQPGDKIRVTGLLKYYGGKTNINERHDTDPDNDVEIELIEANAGLPLPEVVELSELRELNGDYIFDDTRMSGCEYYQGRLVRVNDVTITNCNDFGPGFKWLVIEDDTGRQFNVRLGRGPGFSEYSCPTGEIDVIGIMNQEGSGTAGYEIWVMNYDGNGDVLTDFGDFKNSLKGDINYDGIVDIHDFAALADNWLDERQEGY